MGPSIEIDVESPGATDGRNQGSEVERGHAKSRLEGAFVLDSLAKVMGDISALPECRGPLRRPYGNLARRVKLLSPLFEELRDGGELGDGVVEALRNLGEGLVSTFELLRSVNDGSKLYQALHLEDFHPQFLGVTDQIEKALGDIPYSELDISEEVREQVELIHAQFTRAKGKPDSPDPQLARDINLARSSKVIDHFVLKRLSEKLELRTINDMKKESHALHELDVSSADGSGACLEEMSPLLKKLKDFVLTENPNVEALEDKAGLVKLRSPIIPDDFRCPMSLELMKDPVIVSTGQTYERASIQKWLNAGHKTCPKTQQPLTHTALTPNYVLKSLIQQWCESNGVELPRQQGAGQDNKSNNHKSDCDRAGIELLLQKLRDDKVEVQRAAAGQLRLLAKRNADNRVCIADAGAIPLLVSLLSSTDSRTQEHAVTALLNLSIHESNKNRIVQVDAIEKIVDVLKNGSMEARENAAATLFSLSVIDNNKIKIGEAGAIPALIVLLREGSPRGKKDAATALFNLSIYPDNKLMAVKAGILDILISLLKDSSIGMVDEALAIMAILASHQESRQVIIKEFKFIPVMVALMKTGPSRNREYAAAILYSLCSTDPEQLRIAQECGAVEALKELSESGTDRAKRKAGSLLELIHKSVEVKAPGDSE